MSRILNIIVKVVLSFILIYLGGLATILFKGDINSRNPLPFPIGIITIILIILIWRISFLKTEKPSNNKSLPKKILRNMMYQKYKIIVDSFTEEPDNKITEATDTSITIEHNGFTYSKYIIAENEGQIEVEWYADFGKFGIREKKCFFRPHSQQTIILKHIREYMANHI